MRGREGKTGLWRGRAVVVAGVGVGLDKRWYEQFCRLVAPALMASAG